MQQLGPDFSDGELKSRLGWNAREVNWWKFMRKQVDAAVEQAAEAR